MSNPLVRIMKTETVRIDIIPEEEEMIVSFKFSAAPLWKAIAAKITPPATRMEINEREPEDEDLTPKECAASLKCSITTIYRRTRDGQLPYHRIGNNDHGPIYIKRSDLQKLKTTKRLNGVKF